MTYPYDQWAAAGLNDQPIERADAAAILRGEGIDLLALLHATRQVRTKYFGNTVSVHMLDNVRNGACPEDCGYCGQSSKSDAPIEPYKIKSVDEIVSDATAAKEAGAYRFCMALSGTGPKQRDIDHMCEAIRRIKAMGLQTCLSAGLLDDEKAARLKDAGLDRFNHNLNTSRRHYPAICTTHTYDQRMETINTAKAAGIGVCSGMIIGMGETHEDVLDVAYALRSFKADSIPVNFLLPIEGNRLNEPMCEGMPLNPQFVLRVLCMMRLVNPISEVRVAAGREVHLRSMQAMALYPASSLFVAGYLLTEGDDTADTIRMILDAGFVPKLDEGSWPESVKQMISQAGAERSAAPGSGGSDRLGLKQTVTGKRGQPFVAREAVGLPR